MKFFIKAFALLLLVIVCANHSFSQNISRLTFSGTVKDVQTGYALAGASISIPDLRKGTISNDSGFFSIPNLQQASYLVEITYAGYASYVEVVNITGAQASEFLLKPSFLETEAVTVTGVSSATSVRRNPVPVNIVKKEELLRGSSTNLVDALTKTPGVAQIATGPAISKPIIRGLGYNRVVVVNDGIRQEGQQWGDEHGIEIDELNVTRAEVLKGPASLMYGSDALAGVVNFISIVPAPMQTVKANFLTNYQTNNKQRAFHGDIGGNNNGFIWGAFGSYKAAADYQNRLDDVVYNSRFNEHNYGGYLGLNKDWGFSHIYLSKFNQNVGLVEGTRDSATGRFMKPVDVNGTVNDVLVSPADFTGIEPAIPRQGIRHLKIAADNSFRIGSARLTATVGYQRNERQEFGDISNPVTPGLDFVLHSVNYNLQYHLPQKKNWKTSLGVNGMRQENLNKGTEFLIPEYQLFDIGGFVYTQRTINKLSISGGLRIDNRHLNAEGMREGADIKFEPFVKNFANVSGSIGASIQVSDAVNLKLNVARGYRAPSIPELASNGAHEGTNRFEYGSRDLKSERSLQVDAGLEFTSEHISLSANLFVNSISNFIYYRKLSAAGNGDSILVLDGDDFFAFRFNQANASLYGGEANLDIHPHPLHWLHIENSFSYVRGTLAQEQDGSKNLPFIPAPRLINELKADFLKKGKTFKNLYVNAELDNTFAQQNAFTGYNTETPTPGYSLLNAGFGGDIASKGKTLFSLYFSANNITDVAYQHHLSRLKYTDVNNVNGRQGVFNMGRNFSIKLNVPLEFTVK